MNDDLDDDIWTTIIADDPEGDSQFSGIRKVAIILMGIAALVVIGLVWALFR